MAGSDIALLLLRVVLGGVYIAHGARKLGWIGGGQMADFTASIGRRGFRPAPVWAALAVFSEVVGGALTVLGLLGPVGGALLVAQSVTIAVLVANRGFWHTDEGLEYPLILGSSAVVVAIAGPGLLSVDAAIGFRLASGLPEIFVAAAVAGSLASLLTRRSTEPQAAETGPGAGGPPRRHSG